MTSLEEARAAWQYLKDSGITVSADDGYSEEDAVEAVQCLLNRHIQAMKIREMTRKMMKSDVR